MGAVKVIASYSVKGGVGKTTTAVNLAWQAAALGLRVLVWDLDVQGAATYLLRVKPKIKGGTSDLITGETNASKALRDSANPLISVLPAEEGARNLELILDSAKKSSQRVTKVLNEVADKFDVAILDVPPGASLLAENVLRAADVVVLPLQPSPLSLRSLEQVDALVAETAKPPVIVGFISMADRRRASHRDAIEQLPAKRTEVSPIVIPATVIVERMGENRQAVGEYAPHSEAAAAYAQLWQAVAKAGKVPTAHRR